MALNVRGQYRQVLTVCENGIKRTCSVPAAGGRTWSGAQFVTLKPVNLGEVGFSVTILAQKMWTRGTYNGIWVGVVGSSKSNLAQSDSQNT